MVQNCGCWWPSFSAPGHSADPTMLTDAISRIQWGLVYSTPWGWVTHIYISKLITIGSDNGLSPGRHQAINWTSAGILSIGPLGTNFNEISIKINFSLTWRKMHLKIASAKWRPFCPQGDELKVNEDGFIAVWIELGDQRLFWWVSARDM